VVQPSKLTVPFTACSVCCTSSFLEGDIPVSFSVGAAYRGSEQEQAYIVIVTSDALVDRVESSLVSPEPVHSGAGRGWQTVVLPVVYGSDGRAPK
jgi:hypothetical protein